MTRPLTARLACLLLPLALWAAAPALAQDPGAGPAGDAADAAGAAQDAAPEEGAVDPAQAAKDAEAAANKARKLEVQKALKAAVGDRVDSVAVKIDVPKAPPEGFEAKFNEQMGDVNGVIASVFFYDVGGRVHEAEAPDADPTDAEALRTAVTAFLDEADAEGFPLENAALTLTVPGVGNAGAWSFEVKRSGVPLTVLWLVLGAVFFTVRMGLIQVRGFVHAIRVTKGDYDNPDDHGEVSHFQALTAALSATVGLGNIAGVAIAISVGGPGATVWMIVAGFLGMASKFTECSLGQMYRQRRSDGSVMGGAMYYLSHGLKDMGLAPLGKVLAVMFAVLCVGGSLAGGNSFQVNQSLGAVQNTVPFLADHGWVYGVIMTVLVAMVILGGLKRIAQVAEKVVPSMCGIYVAAALFVILSNASEVPDAFGKIFSGAMTPAAGFGGLLGVLVQGFKRAAFSNEAGVGSAAIAHSAAKTEYPVREGIVALLEPFIDTIVVCTMTALVIVITGAYSPETNGGMFAAELESANGAGLTSKAFGSAISWFPNVLSVAVVLFAFSTMISWSYYGERCWVWLFGDRSSLAYKVLFLTFVFLGSIATGTNVLEFGDLMILGMALPNVLGVVLLSGKVKRALDSYMGKLATGEIQAVEKT